MQTTLIESSRDSQISLWNPTSQASIVCIALNIPFQAPTGQLTKSLLLDGSIKIHFIHLLLLQDVWQNPCLLCLFFVYLTQARVFLRRGNFNRKNASIRLPISKIIEHVLDFNWCDAGGYKKANWATQGDQARKQSTNPQVPALGWWPDFPSRWPINCKL